MAPPPAGNAARTNFLGEPGGREQKIRAEGINAVIDLNERGISKNLDYANKLGIPFVAILGENELKEKEFSLKDMKTGKEKKVKFSDLKKLSTMVE